MEAAIWQAYLTGLRLKPHWWEMDVCLFNRRAFPLLGSPPGLPKPTVASPPQPLVVVLWKVCGLLRECSASREFLRSADSGELNWLDCLRIFVSDIKSVEMGLSAPVLL